MTDRYRIEVDYESDDEWGVGVVPGLEEHGQPATMLQVAQVLERTAALIRRNFAAKDDLPVRYPGRRLPT